MDGIMRFRSLFLLYQHYFIHLEYSYWANSLSCMPMTICIQYTTTRISLRQVRMNREEIKIKMSQVNP